MDPSIFNPDNRVVLDTPLVLFPRVTTAFRGYSRDRYLLLDTPQHEGSSLDFERGMPLTLRLMHESKVYGFEAEVLARITMPFPLLFLTYPKDVESLNLRKGKLYKVMLDTAYTPVPADDVHEIGDGEIEERKGLILNLSENGALLETDWPMEVGESISLSFALPEHGQVDGVKAKVLSCLVKGHACWVELHFGDPEQPACAAVLEYLQHLESRQLEEAMLRLSP
jgi:c-di-GMP-binding flagellar brake protein YcgR